MCNENKIKEYIQFKNIMNNVLLRKIENKKLYVENYIITKFLITNV